VEAKVNQHEDVFVVHLRGQLDFESADLLRAKCRTHFAGKKVVFDLGRLGFVGSSGITPFLELLGELLKVNGTGLKVCSVSTEFMRVFEASNLIGLEVYENEQHATLAFKYPPFVAAAPVPVSFDRLPDLAAEADVE